MSKLGGHITFVEDHDVAKYCHSMTHLNHRIIRTSHLNHGQNGFSSGN